MNKTEKQSLVVSLKNALDQAAFVLVTHQEGLTVSEATDLRRKMCQAGGNYKVAKNTLARLAFKDTAYENLSDHFKGPTAITFSSDPIEISKVIVDFSKANQKIKILGAQMGDSTFGEPEVKALASLPSQDQLRAKLLCLLVTPATRVARVLRAPAEKIARVSAAYGAKEG